jgi:hypothetical protein
MRGQDARYLTKRLVTYFFCQGWRRLRVSRCTGCINDCWRLFLSRLATSTSQSVYRLHQRLLERTVISEVADVGEILLPHQVTSSTVVQVPPLHLVVLQSASSPTIRLEIPTGSSHSSDDSELELHSKGHSVGLPRCQHRILQVLGTDKTLTFVF